MTDKTTPEIRSDEIDWDHAVAHEGRRPGSVVSVRLDPTETARLRKLADMLGMNVSQVLRRALAAYDPTRATTERKVFVSAFTYGGTVPLSYEHVWTFRSGQLQWPSEMQRGSGSPTPTGTEPTRIVERVTA